MLISLGPILIVLYPEKPSMKDINTLPVVLSTKTSIWGKRKSSLGNALFNSLKSPHILTFPSFLGTGTSLAIHSSWFTFLMNNTFSCLVTSFLSLKAFQPSRYVIMSINVMLSYLRVNSRHILIRPCKHLLKFHEEFLKIFSFSFIYR